VKLDISEFLGPMALTTWPIEESETAGLAKGASEDGARLNLQVKGRRYLAN
jgi:hypothetical protein